MKTNNHSLVTKTLLVLGIFGVTTFITYGATGTSGGIFKSTPYQTRNTTADARLVGLVGNSGAIILDGIVNKIHTKALTKGGSPLDISIYNKYLDSRLASMDSMDNEIQSQYGSDYTFLFQYLYPRVYELKKEDSANSILSKISSAFGGDEDTNTGIVNDNNSMSCNAKTFTFTSNGMTCNGKAPIGNQGDIRSISPYLGYGNATLKCSSTGWEITNSLCADGYHSVESPSGSSGSITTNSGISTPVNPPVAVSGLVKISNFSKTIEYYVCGNNRKGEARTASFESEKQFRESGYAGDPTGRSCASLCSQEGSKVNTLCGSSKILSSTEEVTKELDTTKVNFDVTKKEVKAGGESITFYGYFPSGTQCGISYSSQSKGGSQTYLAGPVSIQLFVKNGSYVKISGCKDSSLNKDIFFSETSTPSPLSEVNTITTPTANTKNITDFEFNTSWAKVGDTVSLTYHVSSDRDCTVGSPIQKTLSAGSAGILKYTLKDSDVVNGKANFEIKCTNGSSKGRTINITSSCTSGYTYNSTYSACIKTNSWGTLDCQKNGVVANWYKTYLGRCGETAGIDYWENIIKTSNENTTLSAFKSAVQEGTSQLTPNQTYLNKLLCDAGDTYIQNTNYCKHP